MSDQSFDCFVLVVSVLLIFVFYPPSIYRLFALFLLDKNVAVEQELQKSELDALIVERRRRSLAEARMEYLRDRIVMLSRTGDELSKEDLIRQLVHLLDSTDFES